MSQIYSREELKQHELEARKRSGTGRRSVVRLSDNELQSNDGQANAAANSDTGVDDKANNTLDNPALAGLMKRSQWRIKSSPSSAGRLLAEQQSNICSMCLREDSFPERNEYGLWRRDSHLIASCLCVGKRSRQHKNCIQDWIEQTGARGCPFCNVNYDVTRRRKGFWSYVSYYKLQKELLEGLSLAAYVVYLFFIGLSVCYYHIFDLQSQSCANRAAQQVSEGDGRSGLRGLASDWVETGLFCIVALLTAMLFLGLVASVASVAVRHYVKYWLWSRHHWEVSVRAYTPPTITTTSVAAG